MPNQLQLDAWATAIRTPLVVLALAVALLVALAIATGITPQPLYADPLTQHFM